MTDTVLSGAALNRALAALAGWRVELVTPQHPRFDDLETWGEPVFVLINPAGELVTETNNILDNPARTEDEAWSYFYDDRYSYAPDYARSLDETLALLPPLAHCGWLGGDTFQRFELFVDGIGTFDEQVDHPYNADPQSVHAARCLAAARAVLAYLQARKEASGG